MNTAVHEDSTIPPQRAVVSGAGHKLAEVVSTSSTGPQAFGDYELLDEIARGGMGVVYRARQVGLNRIVALKMILDAQLATEDDVKRFREEAQVAASLNHPHVVQIFDVGSVGEQHYFSMEYIEGESLASLVSRGPLVPLLAAKIMSAACEGVGAAHQQGLVHRDLKPGNILVDKKLDPHVTDFGLARQQGRFDQHESGQLVGTASYMPPEQAAGDVAHIGPHSDVYALGATLYCLLVGRPPFQAATPADTLLQAIHQDPVPARRLNPLVPRDLETICSKCLEKQPLRRYPDAGELAADLRRFLNNEPILARPVSMWIEFWKWTQRNPKLAMVSVVLVAALLALYGVTLTYNAHLQVERQAAVDAERRVVGLLALSESLTSDLSKKRNVETHSLLVRATQLGRITTAADRLRMIRDRSAQGELIDLFENEAGWFDDEQSEVQSLLTRCRQLLTEWQSGSCPSRLADELKLLTVACRQEWRATIAKDEVARVIIERQAASRLAQTLEFILLSSTRGEAEPHIERVQTTHRGLIEVLGLDQLASALSADSERLAQWQDGPLPTELRKSVSEQQRLALRHSEISAP